MRNGVAIRRTSRPYRPSLAPALRERLRGPSSGAESSINNRALYLQLYVLYRGTGTGTGTGTGAGTYM